MVGCVEGRGREGSGAAGAGADVQFVHDGMAGGANLSLLARSRGWSCSSLEKLVRRIKHGDLGTRKQHASRVHAHRGLDVGRHPDKPTSVLDRFGRQIRVLALHESTQVARSGLSTHTSVTRR